MKKLKGSLSKNMRVLRLMEENEIYERLVDLLLEHFKMSVVDSAMNRFEIEHYSNACLVISQHLWSVLGIPCGDAWLRSPYNSLPLNDARYSAWFEFHREFDFDYIHVKFEKLCKKYRNVGIAVDDSVLSFENLEDEEPMRKDVSAFLDWLILEAEKIRRTSPPGPARLNDEQVLN